MEAFNLFYYGRFTSCIFIFQSIFGPNCTLIVVLAALFFTAPFSKPFSRPFAIKSNNYMTKLRVCLTQFSSKLHTVSPTFSIHIPNYRTPARLTCRPFFEVQRHSFNARFISQRGLFLEEGKSFARTVDLFLAIRYNY